MKKDFRIVTNGKYFRIQQRAGRGAWKFVEDFHPDLCGFGYMSPAQFRSYLHALKRVGLLLKSQARINNESWMPVSVALCFLLLLNLTGCVIGRLDSDNLRVIPASEVHRMDDKGFPLNLFQRERPQSNRRKPEGFYPWMDKANTIAGNPLLWDDGYGDSSNRRDDEELFYANYFQKGYTPSQAVAQYRRDYVRWNGGGDP